MPNFRMVIGSLSDDINTLTATSEALPIENVQESGRDLVWRSTSTATQTITGSFSSLQLINCLVLGRHNFSGGATVRYILKNGATTVFDSGTSSVSTIIPAGVFIVGVDPWLATYDDQFDTKAARIWLDQNYYADNFEIQISDATNTDSYIQFGRLFIGLSTELTYNMDYGATLGYQDSSEHIRTDGGGLRTERGFINRTMTFDLSNLNEADRIKLEVDLAQKGTQEDIYFSGHPEEGGLEEITHSFICRRTNSMRFTHNFFQNRTTQLTFEES